MAINPMMFPAGTMLASPLATPQGAAPTTPPVQQPQMQQPQMQQPQGPNTLTELARLMGGDLSGSLSSGDKLLALSGLLRSATRSGRRAGLTPQQVIGELQQRKIAEIQGRMQLETMQREREQQQRQVASVTQFARNLPEGQREAFLGLPLEQQLTRMEQEAFRQRQWVGTFVDGQGRTRNRYLDGTSEIADYSLPPELEIDTYDHDGDGTASRVTRNKVTREIIRVDPLGRTPAEIADDLRADDRLRFDKERPSGDGGLTPSQPAKRWVLDPETDGPVERQVYRDAQGRYRNVQTNEEVTLWGGRIPTPRGRSEQ
jgi:hypothetical protein